MAQAPSSSSEPPMQPGDAPSTASPEGITVRVPATSANIGPCFDSMGLALSLYNSFRCEPAASDHWQLAEASSAQFSDEEAKALQAPKGNLFFAAWQRYFEEAGQKVPTVSVTADIHIPLSRGLGSSSSAIIGGLVAADAWLKQYSGSAGMDTATLCALAVSMEGHPDNVAPALYGGVVLGDDAGAFLRLDWPRHWKIAVVVPPYRLETERARAVLPAAVPRADAIFNLRKSALLTYALLKEDAEAMAAALDDKLHQPYRAELIPDFQPIAAIAASHQALGTVISGAGPCLLVVYDATTVNPHLYEALEAYLKAESQGKPEPYRLLQLVPDAHGALVMATTA